MSAQELLTNRYQSGSFHLSSDETCILHLHTHCHTLVLALAEVPPAHKVDEANVRAFWVLASFQHWQPAVFAVFPRALGAPRQVFELGDVLHPQHEQLERWLLALL